MALLSLGRKAKVVPAGSGAWLSWLCHPACLLILGEDTDDDYSIGRGTVPPGDGPPAHRHEFDEAFYVLDGEATFTAGNRSVALAKGGFIAIRGGTAHTFKNGGATGLDLLVLVGPAGFDRFQMAVGTPVDDASGPFGPVTADQLRRLAEMAPAFGIDLDPPADAFEADPEIVVRHPGEGPSIAVVGDLYTILSHAEETGGRLGVIHAVVPPGGGPPPHIQTREHEGFFVIDGELTFHADGVRVVAGPGTCLNIPPGVLHSFRNETDRPVTQLFWFAPAGLEAIFEETGRVVADPTGPVPSPSPDEIRRLLEAAPRYGVEIPPPG